MATSKTCLKVVSEPNHKGGYRLTDTLLEMGVKQGLQTESSACDREQGEQGSKRKYHRIQTKITVSLSKSHHLILSLRNYRIKRHQAHFFLSPTQLPSDIHCHSLWMLCKIKKDKTCMWLLGTSQLREHSSPRGVTAPGSRGNTDWWKWEGSSCCCLRCYLSLTSVPVCTAPTRHSLRMQQLPVADVTTAPLSLHPRGQHPLAGKPGGAVRAVPGLQAGALSAWLTPHFLLPGFKHNIFNSFMMEKEDGWEAELW